MISGNDDTVHDGEYETARRLAHASTAWQNFLYVSGIVTLLYLGFSVAHYLLLDPEIRFYMVSAALGGAVLNGILFSVFYRVSPKPRLAHPMAAATMSTILVNSGLHLYLTGTPYETTNFVLLLIGCGIFYCSTPWLFGSVAVIMMTWLGIAFQHALVGDWVHFGMFVSQIAILSLLVHTLRIRTADRLLRSQWKNETQRRALEIAVEEKTRAQDRLRLLTEATFEAIFLHQNGKIVDVNDQAVRIFGYTRDEFNYLTMDSLLAPDARKNSPFQRKTLHSATGSNRDGRVHETVARHKDGQTFPIEFGSLQIRPRHGQIDATVVRDVSDRKRLEHRFRDFVENAIDYICETDILGNFTYVNSATRRLIASGQDVIGINCCKFLHADHRERIRNQICKQDFSVEPVLYQEFRILVNENDMERWVGQIIQPIFTNGEISGYRLVARNVTDRVMAVRQALTARRNAEEANRSKSHFLSSMSHELRTPLNGIMGFAQILGENIHGELNEKQRIDLEGLMDCSEHLLNLIEDLLDLSKASIDAIEVRKVPISAEAVVGGATSIVKRIASEKSIDLHVNIEKDIRVKGEPRRLRQILLNLLSNAVKYSPEGAPVQINVRPIGGGFVEFSVIDHGPGVPLEHQEKVFTEFYQADQSRDSGLGGSGIGLALVEKLVTLHGGEVGYRDGESGGSEFWFTLERTMDAIPPLVEDHRKDSPTQCKTLGRILVVDDIEVNIFLIRETLEDRGHTVDVAYNGEEAIRRAMEFKPDLILMDMRMPVMDGFQATQRLKAMPEFARTPIVALTASVSEDAIVDCLSAGCAEHLSKPVHLHDLFECIERNLGHLNEEASETAEDRGSSSALRVLVVDDTEANRDFMLAFFQRLPHEILFAKDGEEAVRIALEQDVDVVLMDVQMPGMNGLEATRAIRMHRDERTLPIVGLSGMGERDDIQECLSAGMNEFITKPVRFRRIVEVLDQYRRHAEKPVLQSNIDGEVGRG